MKTTDSTAVRPARLYCATFGRWFAIVHGDTEAACEWDERELVLEAQDEADANWLANTDPTMARDGYQLQAIAPLVPVKVCAVSVGWDEF